MQTSTMRILMALFLAFAAGVAASLPVSLALLPMHERLLSLKVAENNDHSKTPEELKAETEIRAKELVIKMLKESWGGVLHIKDDQATTVRYKRAALGNKKGFEDLKNGEYKILVYLAYQNATHGVFFDKQNNLWPFVWSKGVTEPPSENPGTIKVTAKRIEVVGAQ